MPALDGVDVTFRDVRQNPQSFSINPNTTTLTNGQSIGLAVSAFRLI